MKEIFIKERELEKLKEYELNNSIVTSESRLYYLKKYYNKPNVLLKKLFKPTDKIMDTKIQTINTISKRKDLKELSELVIPKELAIARGKAIGFSMNEVENTENLGVILNDKNIPFSKKIELLEKVGKLVHKTTNLDKDFFFGDLHEFNFIVDKDDKIYAVDLDSSAINDNTQIESKFLVLDYKLRHIKKYHSLYGVPLPDKNSDIYCYNMMVINALADVKTQWLKYDDYYNYIEYLSNLGVKDNIIEPLSKMYTEHNNELITNIKKGIPKDKDITYDSYKKLLKTK